MSGLTKNIHVVHILRCMVYWYERALEAEKKLKEIEGDRPKSTDK